MAGRNARTAKPQVSATHAAGTARQSGASEAERAAPRSAPREPRSDAMRLAAELELLKTELAAARAAVAALETQAQVDVLTGILNRRGFTRELDRAVAYVTRYGARAALVYLDLDRFKPINDRHGHQAGDAVLQAVAATLAHNVRASDAVARLGGDEFAVLLWNLAEADAATKASALTQAIAAIRLARGGVVLSVGASSGVAMLVPGSSAADVLARADRAMYAHKPSGRRRPQP